MKILQVGPIPPEIGGKSKGGVAIHVWELSTYLAKRGHEVSILADNFFYPEKIPMIKQKVKIYGLSASFLLRFFPNILSLSSILVKGIQLKRHLKGLMNLKNVIRDFFLYKYVIDEFKPDIIHVHHIQHRFPIVYSLAHNRIPIVTTIHSFHAIKFSSPSLRQRYHTLIASNLKLAENLIFISKFIQKELVKFFGEYQGRYWIIEPGIDIRKYYPVKKGIARPKIDLPGNGSVVLFIGHLIKRKGVYTLLEASKILKGKGIDLKIVVIGDGPELGGVKNFIAQSNIQDNVRLIRKVYTVDLLYYYNAADLFVMPSFSEGFAVVYLEAMLCGTPVIGISGIADEAIPSKDYGFLVPPGDAIALAESIENGLVRKWNREKIIEYARGFSWNEKIVKFERLYLDIVRRGRKAK